MSLRVEIIASLKELTAEEWNALAGPHPTLKYAYLLAMEESGCASPRKGWYSQFLVVREEGVLVGAMPLYLKTHSYGEFVFDQSWAEAYERNGLQYYPKLVCSVPFTPVPGPRMLAASAEVRALLAKAAVAFAQQVNASSFHCLFPDESQVTELKDLGFMLRNTVQFHWKNAGYKTFADFLASMKHDKRKKIVQERKRVQEAGVSFRRVRGTEATRQDWEFFFRCYLHTHQIYQSPPSLNLEFFLQLWRDMPENLLLVVGSRNADQVCASFDLIGDKHLYGRWWGAMEYIPGLHFEACYYQAIEFCVEQGLETFEGGAQGEHKLARGLLPVTTWSAHWLAHPEFARAVDDFLQQETGQINQYVSELGSPFRRS